MDLAAALLLAASCAGAGAALLATLGVWQRLDGAERPAWAFGIGTGVIGWLMMFAALAGWLGRGEVASLLACGLPGLWLLRPMPSAAGSRWSLFDRLAAVALVLVLALNVLAVLAPPSDADSVSYHLTLPRLYIEAGKLVFYPRALEGAIPQGIHMTYTAAYALGGEGALLWWLAMGGMGTAAMMFAVASRFLPRAWALAAAALLLSTPAAVYSASSAQVEIRVVPFILAAAIAAARSIREDQLRWVIAAGLAAGFYADTKLLGLLFCTAFALVLLLSRRRTVTVFAFAVAALLAGCQWYLWLWSQTGDPFFPMLWRYVGAAHGYWTADLEAAFAANILASERGVGVNPFWWLAYPFKATLDGLPIFESGRTGFGPVVWVLLPWVAAGLWLLRRPLSRHELGPVGLGLLLHYTLWFVVGGSQRVRHLLPLYPLLLLIVMVAAERASRRADWSRRPLVAAILLSLAIQFGGQLVFARGLALAALGLEPRETFLARTVFLWNVAQWANDHLGPDTRLLQPYRTALYYHRTPFFYCNHSLQAVVDCRNEAFDERRFLAQARAVGVTHVLADVDTGDAPGVPGMVSRLLIEGCVRPVAEFSEQMMQSRTLGIPASKAMPYRVVELVADECRIAVPAASVALPGEGE